MAFSPAPTTGNDVIVSDGTAGSVDALAGNDTVLGAAGQDTITGNTGDDSLVGGDSNDLLEGGLGSDTLDGGAGTGDSASYRDAAAGVTVNLAQGTATGGDGTDALVNIENVLGSAFNDTLTGGAAAALLDGAAGNDTIVSGQGGDVLLGSVGDDTLSYALSTAGVAINLTRNSASGGWATGDLIGGFEAVTGSDFNDTIAGSSDGNQLNGGNGADSLFGAAGSDLLTGGTGADTLNGGDGQDFANYSASAAGVSVNLATGIGSGGDAAGDVLFNFEGVFGSASDDVVTAGAGGSFFFGDAGNDTLVAGAGADFFDGAAGSNSVSYELSNAAVTASLITRTASGGYGTGDTLNSVNGLRGSAFNDVLYGSDLNDSLLGGGGDDFLQGNGGADTIDGGGGQDTVSYADARFTGVFVNLLNGVGSGGVAAGDSLTNVENLVGSALDDVLLGNDVSANQLDGGDGNDFLRGGFGADVLIGGAGTDTASYLTSNSAAGERVYLSSGQGFGTEAEGDRLIGIENLDGSNSTDLLVGDGGRNVLVGNRGNDTLVGAGGEDVLVGGSGSDRFTYLTLADSAPGVVDLVADFSRGEGDVIDLSVLTGGRGYSFVGDAAFTGASPQIHALALGAGRFLVETDAGGGGADLRLVVQTVDVSGPMLASDFAF
ncbi:beta strand repeat-containing protein [Muricoccus radiodurans]|uniref:beta strand repeat-containing protein n=1 Tax=Muricoccus radiodurans TaxID=2231721 RepID=UPI003CE9D37B